jgi:uncharacterized protein involved in exopolysaccharide biosynthesis
MNYAGYLFWVELPFRRKTTFLQVAGAVLGLVLIGTLLWPPVFRSTGKVLVQDNRAQLLVSPGIQEDLSNQPTVVSTPITEEDLNSEVELLTSNFLIEQALNDLSAVPANNDLVHRGLDMVSAVLSLPSSGYDALHSIPSMTARQQLVLKFADKLSATVIKRSNVIEISFKSNDAPFSKVFLNHLIDRYLELHAAMSHDPKAEQFFRSQASVLATRLRASEQQLQAMQLQTGISDLAGQRAALVNQLSNFEGEQRKAAAGLAAAQQQVASLEQEEKATAPRLTKEARIVQNMALQQIKPQVLQLETERAELLSRYRPNSARIREIDAKLLAAHKILDHENQSEVQETTTDQNPTWVALDSQLAQARANAASQAANEATLATQVVQYRQELNQLTTNGLMVERQQREVDSAKDAYLSYLRKGEEARAAQALNQSKILNVSIAQAPDLPLRPDFPNVFLNLLAGIVLALGLGLAAAWFEERNDPRLFSVRALEEVCELPVLATLSDAV